MQKVSEHVYVETGYIGSNVGCIVTEQGLVTVDCPVFPQEIEDWRQKITQISDREIAYSISTDHHYDHSITDGLFCRRIITHKIAYRGMQYFRVHENLINTLKRFYTKEYEENQQFFDTLDVALPQVVFSNNLTLNMGDCTLELTYVGGHAPSTIMIYIPEDKVIFTGDNVEEGNYPFTGEARYGSWIELLEKVAQMDIAAIIPGHGEVCGKEEARILESYFKEMRDQVKALHKSGLKKEEVVEKVKPNVPSSWSLPPGTDLKTQITEDVSRMYEQIEKGLL